MRAFLNEDPDPALLELHKKLGVLFLDHLLFLHMVMGVTSQMEVTPAATHHVCPFTFRPLGEDR